MRARPARTKRSPGSVLQPDQPVTAVPGVNSSTAGKLSRLGITTIEDLLYLTPRRYLDFSRRCRIADLRPDVEQTVFATVWEATAKGIGPRLAGTDATLADESGNIRAVGFGNKYLAKRLTTVTRIVGSERPTVLRCRLTFESP